MKYVATLHFESDVTENWESIISELLDGVFIKMNDIHVEEVECDHNPLTPSIVHHGRGKLGWLTATCTECAKQIERRYMEGWKLV